MIIYIPTHGVQSIILTCGNAHKKYISGNLWENATSGNESPLDFCAGIGTLQLRVVLVIFDHAELTSKNGGIFKLEGQLLELFGYWIYWCLTLIFLHICRFQHFEKSLVEFWLAIENFGS